jgi:hypothetical protein
MAFKMRSGNKVAFKMMGSSSPMKQDDRWEGLSAEEIAKIKSGEGGSDRLLEYLSNLRSKEASKLAEEYWEEKMTHSRDSLDMEIDKDIQLYNEGEISRNELIRRRGHDVTFEEE